MDNFHPSTRQSKSIAQGFIVYVNGGHATKLHLVKDIPSAIPWRQLNF